MCFRTNLQQTICQCESCCLIKPAGFLATTLTLTKQIQLTSTDIYSLRFEISDFSVFVFQNWNQFPFLLIQLAHHRHQRFSQVTSYLRKKITTLNQQQISTSRINKWGSNSDNDGVNQLNWEANVNTSLQIISTFTPTTWETQYIWK